LTGTEPAVGRLLATGRPVVTTLGTSLDGHVDLAGAGGLGRDDGEDRQAVGPRVQDEALDARRDEDRIERLEVLDLGAGADAGAAFEDDVELVGGVVAAAVLLLLGLEADQLCDDTRPVEEVNADGMVFEEPLGLSEVQYVHELILRHVVRRRRFDRTITRSDLPVPPFPFVPGLSKDLRQGR
jgi:hypothetical protein